MAESYTNEIAYQTYRTATQAVLDGKAMIKTLEKEGERAAIRARYETVGTMQEKLAAIHTAWAPFQEQIAQVKADIEKNYEIADENFDIWKGLK